MDSQLKKIDSLLSEKRIKLHTFEPSNRKIWTVVGIDKEYWFDPDLDFVHVQDTISITNVII